MKKEYQLLTRLQHLGTAPLDENHPSAPVPLPAMRTSTVRFNSLKDLEKANGLKAQGQRVVSYGRMGMDTHHELEKVFCALEGADRAFLASSGVGAICMTLFSLLSQGDHFVATDNVYGPVREVSEIVLSRMGITVDFCPGNDLAALEAAIKPETKVLYTESPGSLLMETLDLPALAKLAKKHNLILVVDNTWGSGWIYKPLQMGADITIIAGTKYIGGHSDLMMGAVMVKGKELSQQIMNNQYAMGYSISADDAWLALRGVRTLAIRLKQHTENALKVCDFFAQLGITKQIYFPAYAGDKRHALWQRDATGGNGLMSVELKISNEQARTFVDALDLFSIGFSWGGYESLVQLVWTSALKQHSYWQEDDTQVLRLHIGLEDVNDLIADLSQALQKAGVI
ncbi:trans-sulfuration enzyme family protein [Brackiella oedipodis]|uniref:trans-sulfuration enzyme family protein n=1 Tax=Brackiella oedipodis TaxID=124225 RepID=UPI00048F93C8|nr:aminotransferase class I/II-fold pyridoxal phosphate-dependent enzyme [Brackiella oedipodis]